MDLPRKSANYTHQERTVLMAIVKRYKPTVDCKKTDKLSVAKKEVIWNAIAKTYNHSRFRTTGPRSAESLKRLYNNTKFRNRVKVEQEQNTTGQSQTNVDGSLSTEESNQLAESNDLVIDVKIERDLKKTTDDESNKESSSISYDPLSTEADQQILEILNEGPAENLYNEAAEFFGNARLPLITQLGTEETSEEESPIIPEKAKATARKHKHPMSFVRIRPKPRRDVENEACGEIMTNKSSEFLKRVYYRKKIELVHLKKRNEVQKYQYEQLKQYLEIKILNKQLERELAK